MNISTDESDDDEDRPSRKRRMAERAVEGEAGEDEEVCYRVDTLLVLRIVKHLE